ncbi:MAG: AlpA family phage regulatory protein [Curvibacter lanceolatus]|nr:AlpA family phage regulatory protein [Curvibacter lanceolatus]
MKTNYLRAEQVASTLGLSKRTVERHVDSGLMVRPIRLGARATAFPEQEVSVVLAARAVGRTDGEVRALVEQLHAQRELQAVQVVTPIQAAALRDVASLQSGRAPSSSVATPMTPSVASARRPSGADVRTSIERWNEFLARPGTGGRNAPAR